MAYELPADGTGPKRLRTSRTAAEAPVAAEIQEDEILLNSADGIIYFKDSSGAVDSLNIAAVGNVTGLQAALDAKPTSTTVLAIVFLTEAAYAALDPKVATTLYITDGSGIYVGSTAVGGPVV